MNLAQRQHTMGILITLIALCMADVVGGVFFTIKPMRGRLFRCVDAHPLHTLDDRAHPQDQPASTTWSRSSP